MDALVMGGNKMAAVEMDELEMMMVAIFVITVVKVEEVVEMAVTEVIKVEEFLAEEMERGVRKVEEKEEGGKKEGGEGGGAGSEPLAKPLVTDEEPFPVVHGAEPSAQPLAQPLAQPREHGSELLMCGAEVLVQGAEPQPQPYGTKLVA
ncbi:hypothetical protein CYMTET_14396 [Cymbomonas tetramitiformis]|uniref:Uncharacterized protein n=1 Tax=Cymbomonas tetramitiformis TaxID=36881 RepID=A0AAE0LA23_9CHLO|nr:hypothetical protein CYMTET_14396 [Cymbomonas tetramitiformis]